MDRRRNGSDTAIGAEMSLDVVAVLPSRGTRADRRPRRKTSRVSGLRPMRGRLFYLAVLWSLGVRGPAPLWM
jgi:hypothetical protein